MTTRESIGASLKMVALLVFLGAGLWGMVLIFSAIRVGLVGTLLMLIFFPVVLGLAPLYLLITDGYWLPIAVNYGGAALAAVLYSIGSALHPD